MKTDDFAFAAMRDATPTTRRRFLQQTAGLTAGAAVLGKLPAPAQAASAPDPALLPTIKLGRHQITRLIIGGSIALIMSGHLQRPTEDMDLVDEVPEHIRLQYELLAELDHRYGFQLSHFQSHYLPSGWQNRLRSYAVIRQLNVFLVDPYDIFVGKLFSARRKDRADLNAMTSKLEHATILERLRTTTAGLRSDAHLLDAAKQNWFILYGEELPA